MGLKVYKCNHCGNVLMVMKDGGVVPVCCGESMTELKVNTVDGVGEKHVPVVERDGERVVVRVGAVPHPMTAEHYIEWIVVVAGGQVLTAYLGPEDSPEAEFRLADLEGDVVAYAYCNLHGLWVEG